jgi:hypothetical protein
MSMFRHRQFFGSHDTTHEDTVPLRTLSDFGLPPTSPSLSPVDLASRRIIGEQEGTGDYSEVSTQSVVEVTHNGMEAS